MSIIPIRMVNLVAASVEMKDIMAVAHADINANSTWLVPNETPTDPTVGPGSYSMTLRSPSGGVELNLINSGTPAAPSATTVKQGINPDGSADPILDSTAPWVSSLNFSGADGGFAHSATPGNVEFILVEWADAIMLLFKNAARTLMPAGWHFGKIMQTPIGALASSGSLRMDGHMILSGVPREGSGDVWGSTSQGCPQRRRIATGQSVSTSGSGISASWAQGIAGQRIVSRIPASVDSAYIYGPAAERVLWPVVLSHQHTTANSDHGWLMKYLRFTPEIMPPFSFFRVGIEDQYMVIGTSTANSGLAIPIIDGFIPNP